MSASAVESGGAANTRRHAITGAAVALLLAVTLLMWAKWAPYTAKLEVLSSTRRWQGHSILRAADVRAGTAPSLHAAWSFTVAYGLAVWKALVAALLIAAAAQSFVPRAWLVSALSRRRTTSSALAGGVAALPSMMCTCCTAPVAVSLRRCGVPTCAVLAYWMGNPLLNPAVLVFLALVAPWQWLVTRVVVGTLLVVVGSTVVTRITRRHEAVSRPDVIETPDDGRVTTTTQSLNRFARALLRLLLVLVPEYFAAVFVVGLFAGWLFPLGASAGHGVAATAAALVLGTLFVVPTGGEIPLVQGLFAAGFGTAVAGALLVTLPAVSLPSLVMVGRALGWRVTAAAAGVVVVGGAAAALTLSALS